LAASKQASKAVPYLERLLGNDYVQDNLLAGLNGLRAAYGRASKRGAAKAAEDKKLRRQVRDSVGSLREAASALKTGREKPKRRGRRAVLLVIAAGAAAALAANEGVRARLSGTTTKEGA
jgi:hypothetical protein